MAMKTVRSLATVGWNAHRLKPTAMRVHCVLCGYLGKLKDIPTECLVQPGNAAREVARFEGSYDNFKKVQVLQNDTEKKIRFINAKTTSIAVGDIVKQLPDAALDWAKAIGLAGPVPEWVKKVRPTHRRLKFGGGPIACTKCGSISSSGAGNSNLCRVGSTKLAEGSKGRLHKVFAGTHPQSV